MQFQGQWEVKESSFKGSGKSRTGSGRSRKCNFKGSGRSRKGSRKGSGRADDLTIYGAMLLPCSVGRAKPRRLARQQTGLAPAKEARPPPVKTASAKPELTRIGFEAQYVLDLAGLLDRGKLLATGRVGLWRAAAPAGPAAHGPPSGGESATTSSGERRC